MPAIERNDARRRLVGGHDRAGVLGQPCGQPLLISPGETALRVLGELDIIRRVGVDEVVGPERERAKVASVQRPAGKQTPIGQEISAVANGCVAAIRRVERALTVEAAQPVVAGAIEVVEKFRCFLRAGLPMRDHLVEAFPIGVVDGAVVGHRQAGHEAVLHPLVEIDEVRIGVVEQRLLWLQVHGDRQAAAEGFHETTPMMLSPQRQQERRQPALATGPLEDRLDGRGGRMRRQCGGKDVHKVRQRIASRAPGCKRRWLPAPQVAL